MYGIILESEENLAKRNHSDLIVKELMLPENTNKDEFLKMAVFQYMIGNTDWSVQYLQNIKLLIPDSTGIPVTVPYDFDHAGIVNAPYAKPAEELQMSSIRERRFQGYCIRDIIEFRAVFELFKQCKTDIYNVYSNSALHDEKYKRSTLKYLDEFYKMINDQKNRESEFTYPCQKNGTGNVVIKGLRKN